jgi:hypothetical protein
MGVRALCSLDQFIHDMWWGRLVRITHPKINNILSPLSRFCLQLIDNIENIRGQTFNSLKIFNQDDCSSTLQTIQNKTARKYNTTIQDKYQHNQAIFSAFLSRQRIATIALFL